MLTISMEDSSVNRCIKYGYDLSKRKDWKTAANCQDYTSKIVSKNSAKLKETKKIKARTGLNRRNSPKRKASEAKGWF